MSQPIIHSSPLPDADIPDMALTSYVLEHAADHPDKPALIDGPSGRTLTYGELDGHIRALAGGLKARGFGKGDTMAIMAPNVPEYAVLFHGAAMAGGSVTTINPTYTAKEMNHQITDAKPSIMVTVGLFLDTAREAAKDSTITDVFTIDEVEGASQFTELFGETLDQQVPVDADDIVALPYSSGTTGLSKGVMLSHGNLVANIAQTVSAAELTPDESFVAVLPFFHIYGMQVLMNSGLRVGATIITMPRFDLEQFLSLNAEHHTTRAFVAPPIVVALAKHPLVDKFDLSSLEQIFSGAAPLSADTAEQAAKRLDCEVVQGYGMTELSPVSHLTTPGGYKPGSVGVTAPNTECQIVDPISGDSLDIDGEGELWVRGPQVMKGYLGRQEESDATVDSDGWLHTGDVATVDSDGHVFIVDRLKELIKYKGFQVPPAELESVLLNHPDVADSAVIGIPEESAGEIPVGYVVLKEGATASAEDIMEFVAGEVASYKKLQKITFLDEIPKSASGKILRRELRDQASAEE
ncbi:MAG: 4-coumarate--CoA ligase family protein [Euzebya sp.]